MPGHHPGMGTSHSGHTSSNAPHGGSSHVSGGNNHPPDRIQRISSGVEPGHRPTDARPHGLPPEEAHRRGLITKDQMNQAMNNPGIDTSGNYQEKIGFWDQVTNAASEYIESGGLIGNVLKLGGNVLNKLGEVSSDLQKKAMTYSLNNKITAIGKKDDFHPGAYGYKIQDIQKDIDAIEKGDFTQSDFNKKYGSPEISVGGGDGQDRDLMNMVAPVAPYAVGGTTPQDSVAAKWYASLGNNNNNNAFGFSFQKEYNAAKQKQAGILGSPSAVGMLAVNNSPFYNFLKERNLDKGIL